MRGGFYRKIALGNIQNNLRLYLPRVFAEAGLLGSFYILFTLANDKRMANALGGGYLTAFMGFGAIVIGLLSFVLILYINSFLMKQRKGDYGLYNVLGMEKRHIVRVLFAEAALAAAASGVLGLCFGMLFYKLASLLICKLLQTEVVAGFYYLSLSTILPPLVVFLALDGFAFVVNSISVYRLKPVELLAGRHTGEKEPRVRWLLLVIGVLTLGSGYYYALTTKSPLSAILVFFGAVILVIIGTYCLFITGTTFVLKCLKRNPHYYYNKRHMPAVAGLLFRMKQNAVGLASIAILATGVLVMISTTVSLYCGTQDAIEAGYPRQLYISGYRFENGQTEEIPAAMLEDIVRQAAENNGAAIADIATEQYLSVAYLEQDGQLLTKGEVDADWNMADITGTVFITLDTYNRLRGQSLNALLPGDLKLSGDEIAVCKIATGAGGLNSNPEAYSIGGKSYPVAQWLESFPVDDNWGSTVVNILGIVVADDAALEEIYQAQKAGFGVYASDYTDRLGVSFADEAAVFAVGDALNGDIFRLLDARYPGGFELTLDTKWEGLRNMLEMYGTFLFLGLLLGFVCMFATVLIMYYKQISEGYEDRERFQIMQKIGMEAREVKKTIRSQLVLQFCLPLATAGIHTAFAFPILLILLKILRLSNTGLFITCTLITYAVFAAAYALAYSLTAKTYYRIVH